MPTSREATDRYADMNQDIMTFTGALENIESEDWEKHLIVKTNDDSSDNADGLPDTKYYKDACLVTGFSQKRISSMT